MGLTWKTGPAPITLQAQSLRVYRGLSQLSSHHERVGLGLSALLQMSKLGLVGVK